MYKGRIKITALCMYIEGPNKNLAHGLPFEKALSKEQGQEATTIQISNPVIKTGITNCYIYFVTSHVTHVGKETLPINFLKQNIKAFHPPSLHISLLTITIPLILIFSLQLQSGCQSKPNLKS